VSPRRSGSRTPRRAKAVRSLQLLAGFAAAGLAIVAGIMFYAERSIAPLFDTDWRGQYTTRIYSAPFRLRVGDALAPGELRARLKRLDYRPAAPDARSLSPGEFAAEGERLRIHLRDFRHPLVPATPVAAEIELDQGRVHSLRLAGTGAPLVSAALEPELLYEVSGKRRVRRAPLRAEDIPPRMLEALVAAEDRRFFAHRGLDLRGIARAAWRNLLARRITEGGSTLTQQLAKNLFLSPQRTFSRKFREALCAFYLEARYPKEEIIRIYLDSVYFGQDGPVNIIGLSAAAQHYFGRPPSALSLAQSAFLAGLLRSPGRYNPMRDPAAALQRRGVVLAAMRQEGFITSAEEEAAAREPLGALRGSRRLPHESDYFLSYVQGLLEERYADEAWLTRGMTIHTTLDPWMQELARAAVQRAKYQAAFVALDPRSGAVRAMVGGKDYAAAPYNRAALALRQPGSAFKPFVYGAALHDAPRWTLASLLSDATASYSIPGGTWTPRNYDRHYRGPVPLRSAFALSLNAATVGLAAELTPARVIAYARRLGIRSPLRPELGLALGASEVTLLELVGAYCPFANGGLRVEPYALEAALDAEGTALDVHASEPQSVLDPGEAYLMRSLLREVVMTGTAQPLKRWDLNTLAAGKTGTTDDGKDAWFVGFTPRIAAGVWTGTDLPARLGLSGATDALPVWAEFARSVEPPPGAREGLEGDAAWPRPEGVVSVRIDPASGLRARAGCPESRTELFLAGTEPLEDCPLHPGGIVGWFKSLFRGK